jgi:hypothetical protein
MNDAADHPPVVDTGLPRVSVDKSGCNFENCSSLSHKNPTGITKLLFKSLNQTSSDLDGHFKGPKPRGLRTGPSAFQ